LAAQGRDVILSHDRFAASRAFANKIWNAARFVMMNLDGAPQPLPRIETAKLGLAERWILSRLDDTIREVTRSIDVYEFNVAAMKLYQFIWHEFCDWYIELSKEPLKAGGERQAAARWVLVNVFDKMLRLIHPFMPFVSEEIWQVIRPYLDEPNLAAHLPIAKYPEASVTNPLSAAEETAMNHCIEATEAINSLRSLLGWQPGQRAQAKWKAIGLQDQILFVSWKGFAKTLAKLNELEAADESTQMIPGFFPKQLPRARVWVSHPANFDLQVLRETLLKKRNEVVHHLDRHIIRREDRNFWLHAKDEAKAETLLKIEELNSQKNLLDIQLQELGAGD